MIDRLHNEIDYMKAEDDWNLYLWWSSEREAEGRARASLSQPMSAER
jgi:hypothetical protein